MWFVKLLISVLSAMGKVVYDPANHWTFTLAICFFWPEAEDT